MLRQSGGFPERRGAGTTTTPACPGGALSSNQATTTFSGCRPQRGQTSPRCSFDRCAVRASRCSGRQPRADLPGRQSNIGRRAVATSIEAAATTPPLRTSREARPTRTRLGPTSAGWQGHRPAGRRGLRSGNRVRAGVGADDHGAGEVCKPPTSKRATVRLLLLCPRRCPGIAMFWSAASGRPLGKAPEHRETRSGDNHRGGGPHAATPHLKEARPTRTRPGPTSAGWPAHRRANHVADAATTSACDSRSKCRETACNTRQTTCAPRVQGSRTSSGAHIVCRDRVGRKSVPPRCPPQRQRRTRL